MLLVRNALHQATRWGKWWNVMLQALFDGPILGALGNALVVVAIVFYCFVSFDRRAQRRQQNLQAKSRERLRTLGT